MPGTLPKAPESRRGRANGTKGSPARGSAKRGQESEDEKRGCIVNVCSFSGVLIARQSVIELALHPAGLEPATL
jgi:hypothetical protein